MPDKIATNSGITQNRPPRPARARRDPLPIRTAAPMPSECRHPRTTRRASPAPLAFQTYRRMIPHHATARRATRSAIRAPDTVPDAPAALGWDFYPPSGGIKPPYTQIFRPTKWAIPCGLLVRRVYAGVCRACIGCVSRNICACNGCCLRYLPL